MKNIKEKIIEKKEYIILFLVALFIMMPFLGKNYIEGNDTDFHMSNIYAIYQNLINGNSLGLDKILPILGHDFGYATGIFYPRLAHVFTAYISVLCLGNIAVSLKIVHFLIYFFSAVLMYKLINKVFKNKFVAMVAGIFYITAPYAITETFTRDALAESCIYLFMPMILLGLYELFNGEKKYFYIWFTIGYIGILSSHLVLSVYFTVFVLIYLALNIKKVFTKQNFLALLTSSAIILIITSPFTVPILEHKAQGIYHVFESDAMSNRQTIAYSAMTLEDFFKQEPSEKFVGVHYYISILSLLLAISSIIMFKRMYKDSTEKKFYIFLILISIFSMILMSNLIPWGDLPQIIIMIQFAWRLETILIFGLSALAALALRNMANKKIKILTLIIILMFNAFTVYNSYSFDQIKEYNIQDIPDISNNGMGFEKEYLPEVTINNLEYFNNRNNDIIVPEKSGVQVEIQENSVPNLKVKISNVKKDTPIELPRIYYLGYEATYIDENGNKENLELYMNGNGFIETVVDKTGTIQLEYKGTILNKIANTICIVTILFIVCVIVRYIEKHKMER